MNPWTEGAKERGVSMGIHILYFAWKGPVETRNWVSQPPDSETTKWVVSSCTWPRSDRQYKTIEIWKLVLSKSESHSQMLHGAGILTNLCPTHYPMYVNMPYTEPMGFGNLKLDDLNMLGSTKTIKTVVCWLNICALGDIHITRKGCHLKSLEGCRKDWGYLSLYIYIFNWDGISKWEWYGYPRVFISQDGVPLDEFQAMFPLKTATFCYTLRGMSWAMDCRLGMDLGVTTTCYHFKPFS